MKLTCFLENIISNYFICFPFFRFDHGYTGGVENPGPGNIYRLSLYGVTVQFLRDFNCLHPLLPTQLYHSEMCVG